MFKTALLPVDNLQGWDRERDGNEAWKGGDMGVPMADSW